MGNEQGIRQYVNYQRWLAKDEERKRKEAEIVKLQSQREAAYIVAVSMGLAGLLLAGLWVYRWVNAGVLTP